MTNAADLRAQVQADLDRNGDLIAKRDEARAAIDNGPRIRPSSWTRVVPVENEDVKLDNWRVNLWLDDVRPAPDGWVHVKTATEAIAHFARGEVDTASLDHDLGPAEAGTGYDVLAWIEKAMAEHAWYGPLPRIFIHSANPVGRKRMQAVVPKIAELYAQFRGDL